MINLFWSG